MGGYGEERVETQRWRVETLFNAPTLCYQSNCFKHLSVRDPNITYAYCCTLQRVLDTVRMGWVGSPWRGALCVPRRFCPRSITVKYLGGGLIVCPRTGGQSMGTDSSIQGSRNEISMACSASKSVHEPHDLYVLPSTGVSRVRGL